MSKQSRDKVTAAIVEHGDAEIERLREQVRVLTAACDAAYRFSNKPRNSSDERELCDMLNAALSSQALTSLERKP